jgi:hypothetical protein
MPVVFGVWWKLTPSGTPTNNPEPFSAVSRTNIGSGYNAVASHIPHLGKVSEYAFTVVEAK